MKTTTRYTVHYLRRGDLFTGTVHVSDPLSYEAAVRLSQAVSQTCGFTSWIEEA